MTIHSGLLRPRLAPTYPLYLHALPSLCIRIRKSRRCLLLTQRLPASRISSISTRALLDLVSNTVSHPFAAFSYCRIPESIESQGTNHREGRCARNPRNPSRWNIYDNPRGADNPAR